MENIQQPTLQQVQDCLRRQRFDLHNEKVLQGQIESALRTAGLPFQREARLNEANIIDFLVGDIGVEIKIKGGPKAIYQQCLSYCGFAQVKQLLLLTNKSLMLPTQLQGKPIHLLNLGLAWL